jgi:hypothetical protein
VKNYQLLGFWVSDSWSAKGYEEAFEGLVEERGWFDGRPPDPGARLTHIEVLIGYLCWKHMGFLEMPDVTPELEEGLFEVTDYFHGDWWTEQSLRRLAKESPELAGITEYDSIEDIIESNAELMDRSSPEGDSKWRRELRAGIIFGGLLGKWDEVVHICSALDADVSVEYSAGTIIDQYFHFYLVLAGKLSGQWTDGMQKLLDSAKKCRLKRLREVIAAWEAAVAGDQAAFDKTFPAAVKSFFKRKDDPSEYMGVALDETVIWLIAERAGLTFPDLPDKLKAAVITRQSVQLDGKP